MVSQILDLKTEEKCFFVIQIPVAKFIGKTAIWTILCFWLSAANYTNRESMFLMQKSHVQWRVLWNLLCNTDNLVLPEKNLKTKDFSSLNLIFKLLVWVPEIIKTYIISDVIGKCMPSIQFKTSNCKISH